MQGGNYVFTTEGHPIPVNHPLMRRGLPQCTAASTLTPTAHASQTTKLADSPSAAAYTEPGVDLSEIGNCGGDSGAAAAGSSPATGRSAGDGRSFNGEEGVVQEGAAQEQLLEARGPGGALEMGPGLGQLNCRGEKGVRRVYDVPLEWGTLHANASALDALVCPDFTQVLQVDMGELFGSQFPLDNLPCSRSS